MKRAVVQLHCKLEWNWSIARQLSSGGSFRVTQTQLGKEKKVQEKADRVLKARTVASKYCATSRPREGSRLAAALENGEIEPPWRAPPPPSTGVEWLVEQQVRQAQKRGLMDNLAGSGKPLAGDPHVDNHFCMDAGQAALNRMLKNAGFKPPSVEAREEMLRERKRRDAIIAREVQAGASFNDLCHSPRGVEARAAQVALESAIRSYNSVLIVDRENFGSSWPLHQAKTDSFPDAVTAALNDREVDK